MSANDSKDVNEGTVEINEFKALFPKMETVLKENSTGIKIVDYSKDEVLCLGHDNLNNEIQHKLSKRSFNMMMRVRSRTSIDDIPVKLIDTLDKTRVNDEITKARRKKERHKLFRCPSSTDAKRCTQCYWERLKPKKSSDEALDNASMLVHISATYPLKKEVKVQQRTLPRQQTKQNVNNSKPNEIHNNNPATGKSLTDLELIIQLAQILDESKVLKDVPLRPLQADIVHLFRDILKAEAEGKFNPLPPDHPHFSDRANIVKTAKACLERNKINQSSNTSATPLMTNTVQNSQGYYRQTIAHIANKINPPSTVVNSTSGPSTTVQGNYYATIPRTNTAATPVLTNTVQNSQSYVKQTEVTQSPNYCATVPVTQNPDYYSRELHTNVANKINSPSTVVNSTSGPSTTVHGNYYTTISGTNTAATPVLTNTVQNSQSYVQQTEVTQPSNYCATVPVTQSPNHYSTELHTNVANKINPPSTVVNSTSSPSTTGHGNYYATISGTNKAENPMSTYSVQTVPTYVQSTVVAQASNCYTTLQVFQPSNLTYSTLGSPTTKNINYTPSPSVTVYENNIPALTNSIDITQTYIQPKKVTNLPNYYAKRLYPNVSDNINSGMNSAFSTSSSLSTIDESSCTTSSLTSTDTIPELTKAVQNTKTTVQLKKDAKPPNYYVRKLHANVAAYRRRMHVGYNSVKVSTTMKTVPVLVQNAQTQTIETIQPTTYNKMSSVVCNNNSIINFTATKQMLVMQPIQQIPQKSNSVINQNCFTSKTMNCSYTIKNNLPYILNTTITTYPVFKNLFQNIQTYIQPKQLTQFYSNEAYRENYKVVPEQHRETLSVSGNMTKIETEKYSSADSENEKVINFPNSETNRPRRRKSLKPVKNVKLSKQQEQPLVTFQYLNTPEAYDDTPDTNSYENISKCSEQKTGKRANKHVKLNKTFDPVISKIFKNIQTHKIRKEVKESNREDVNDHDSNTNSYFTISETSIKGKKKKTKQKSKLMSQSVEEIGDLQKSSKIKKKSVVQHIQKEPQSDQNEGTLYYVYNKTKSHQKKETVKGVSKNRKKSTLQPYEYLESSENDKESCQESRNYTIDSNSWESVEETQLSNVYNTKNNSTVKNKQVSKFKKKSKPQPSESLESSENGEESNQEFVNYSNDSNDCESQEESEISEPNLKIENGQIAKIYNTEQNSAIKNTQFKNPSNNLEIKFSLLQSSEHLIEKHKGIKHDKNESNYGYAEISPIMDPYTPHQNPPLNAKTIQRIKTFSPNQETPQTYTEFTPPHYDTFDSSNESKVTMVTSDPESNTELSHSVNNETNAIFCENNNYNNPNGIPWYSQTSSHPAYKKIGQLEQHEVLNWEYLPKENQQLKGNKPPIPPKPPKSQAPQQSQQLPHINLQSASQTVHPSQGEGDHQAIVYTRINENSIYQEHLPSDKHQYKTQNNPVKTVEEYNNDIGDNDSVIPAKKKLTISKARVYDSNDLKS